MNRRRARIRATSFFAALSLAGFCGCQPEGTGSVKGPANRGSGDSLGRPFGNAPETPGKKDTSAPEKTKKKAVESANPRL